MYIFAIVNPNTMKTGTIFSVEEFAIHDGPESEQRYFSRDVLYAVHGAIIPKVYRHSCNT